MAVNREDVTIGTRLITGEGFTCVPSNTEVVVKQDDVGFYFYCAMGKHYLDGQIEGNDYVGLSLAPRG